jgi:hypothetical protein
MSANTSSNEMLALLLRALENAEKAQGEFPVSTLQKPADLSDAKPRSVSATEEPGSNPLVERVAAAMLRRSNRAPTRTIN